VTELFCSVTSLVSDVPEKFPSDLTLFLVGSGIALLIALLAWVDKLAVALADPPTYETITGKSTAPGS